MKIKITAQKRKEPLIDVPIAVSVIQKNQMYNLFAHNIETLQLLVPSLSYRKGNTNRNSTLTIRGIGTVSFSTAVEPSVSTVVDGVVLGRSGQAFSDLYDLERVEVLRGPQGTLFGKNASAGVINITTQSPKDTFGVTVDTRIFEDYEYRMISKVEGPISNDASASLTLLTAGFNGYVTNVYNNEAVNGYERTGLRGKLHHNISSDLKLKIILESYNADDNCCADLEGLPSGRNPASGATPNSSGIDDNDNADIDLKQRRIDHDFETKTTDETKAVTIQFDQRIFDFTLTSITGYRIWENTEYREGDFTSIAGSDTTPVFDVPFQLHDIGPSQWHQASQEVRLASSTDGRHTYQLGAFLWDMASKRSFTRSASCQNNAGQNDAILAANQDLSCNANDIVEATAHFTTHFQNSALFGDGRIEVINDLRVLYGLRYAYDKISFKHNRVNSDAFGRQGVGVKAASDNSDFQNKTDETNLSGKLGLQYDMFESIKLYATWTQGYKGPGFNVFYNMVEKDIAPINPEKSNAYEFGLKIADNNFYINTALFYTLFSGFQANNFDLSGGTTITRLTNAGDVSTYGAEVDYNWQITDNLNVSGRGSYIQAKIDKFNCPAGIETCSERINSDLPFSPDFKITVASTYTIPTSIFYIILHSSLIYTDEQQSDLPNNETGEINPAALLPAFYQLNANIALSFNQDAFRITFIGKNLTDKHYVTTYSGDNFRYQYPRDGSRYFGLAFTTKLF
ncbi:MAG: TonB-dependent receptor [Fibrobacterales bacterium]